MARIFRRTVTIGLATALLSMSLGVAPAFAGNESTLVNKTNSARAANGKAPLQVYWDLTDDARAHSQDMADSGSLYHNPNLGSVTTGWKTLGENVGVGPDINAIFNAFMGSSAHRKNILGNFNYIGVGVKSDDSGRLWVTMVFMLGDDDLLDPTTTTQPPDTTTTTTTQPPSTTTTQPPSSTTTQPPSGTTTTTTLPPDEEPVVEPFEIPEEEFAVLTADWVSPTLFRLIGSVGR